MTSPRTLTRDEKLTLQAECAAGKIPSLDEIRDFIHTTRVSYLAQQAGKKEPKSRVKKAVIDESQVDFF